MVRRYIIGEEEVLTYNVGVDKVPGWVANDDRLKDDFVNMFKEIKNE